MPERSVVEFGQASFTQDVPVLEIPIEDGAAIVQFSRIVRAAGHTITLQGSAPTVSEVRECENVIAQTTGGRTDRVVVSGAHLDSVIEGPGINDNGSGSAAQLETALQMAELGIEPRNQVRFIWFGAGRPTSSFAVLRRPGTTRELKDIAVIRNCEMGGSPNSPMVRVRRRCLGHRVHRVDRLGRR